MRDEILFNKLNLVEVHISWVCGLSIEKRLEDKMISSNLLKEIQECQECLYILNYNKFPLVAHGKTDASYMLISEAPGEKSLNSGRYWTGKGGQIIRAVMRELGKELEDVFYLTDIVKCWTNENGRNRKPTQAEVSSCSVFLEREISELKPDLIIAFDGV